MPGEGVYILTPRVTTAVIRWRIGAITAELWFTMEAIYGIKGTAFSSAPYVGHLLSKSWCRGFSPGERDRRLGLWLRPSYAGNEWMRFKSDIVSEIRNPKLQSITDPS